MYEKDCLFIILLASVNCSNPLHAQARADININSQPDWGPTGYNHVDYYYLPGIDVYYNVSQQLFIYPQGNRWIYAKELPLRYRKYNLYKQYKAVINEPKPYLHADLYREKYGRYKDWKGSPQENIRDAHTEQNQNRPHDNGKHMGEERQRKTKDHK